MLDPDRPAHLEYESSLMLIGAEEWNMRFHQLRRSIWVLGTYAAQ